MPKNNEVRNSFKTSGQKLEINHPLFGRVATFGATQTLALTDGSPYDLAPCRVKTTHKKNKSTNFFLSCTTTTLTLVDLQISRVFFRAAVAGDVSWLG